MGPGPGPMGPGPGPKGSWNDQNLFGMTKIPKSSGKYLGKFEDAKAQDPHQQMRHEKLV